MTNQLHYRVLAMVVVYGILKFLGGSFGSLVLYPVTLLVTFLHEFGHAMGAILTGGGVGRLMAHWVATGKPDLDVTGINIDRLHPYQANPRCEAI